jgi:hypothetical protein
MTRPTTVDLLARVTDAELDTALFGVAALSNTVRPGEVIPAAVRELAAAVLREQARRHPEVDARVAAKRGYASIDAGLASVGL